MGVKTSYLKELQKNKPHKEESTGWKYILHDGSNWRQFYYPCSPSAIKRMENEVTNPLNWASDEERNYTIIRNIPPFDVVLVKKMLFPDGRIWDSQEKKFKHVKKR